MMPVVIFQAVAIVYVCLVVTYINNNIAQALIEKNQIDVSFIGHSEYWKYNA
jgi:hypothetical protein